MPNIEIKVLFIIEPKMLFVSINEQYISVKTYADNVTKLLNKIKNLKNRLIIEREI